MSLEYIETPLLFYVFRRRMFSLEGCVATFLQNKFLQKLIKMFV